jgi:phosphopentomutase
MKKRAIILIIDSLGVGAMDDVAQVRPQDLGANTFGHLLDTHPDLKIPCLKQLGIGSILSHSTLESQEAIASFGSCRLMHEGADSYLGHQEIMGTKPMPATIVPFSDVMDAVKIGLEEAGYCIRIPDKSKPYLLVNEAVVVADNIETDYGQIYNVTGAIDEVPFDEILKIGLLVRGMVAVNRVIALGGEGVSTEWILSCVEKREDGLVGVNSPKSQVYKKGYQARHIGLGVDPFKQLASIAVQAGLETVLIGKMQDVIACHGARKVPAVDTGLVLSSIESAMDEVERGLIAATIQETDLAGHAQDADRYATLVEMADRGIERIMEKMTAEDLLIISADHGNDPCVGHSQHTREKTFLLVFQKEREAINLGNRDTLSDIAASAASFLGVDAPENGTSFIKD